MGQFLSAFPPRKSGFPKRDSVGESILTPSGHIL
jgi:hypothetical protein